MNPHFEMSGGVNWPEYPRHAYGRVDYVEQTIEEKFIIGVDVIEADALLDIADSFYRFTRIFFHELLNSRTKTKYENLDFNDSLNEKINRKLDEIPLYHVEIEGTKKTINKYFRDRIFQSQTSDWISLFFTETNRRNTQDLSVQVYRGLFADPVSVSINGVTNVPDIIKNFLKTIFSTHGCQSFYKTNILKILTTSKASWLASYDVGQGSATALLSDFLQPTMYYDIGSGVYRNAKTRSHGLILCHCNYIPILLSHWDTDHWAGAISYAPASDPKFFLRQTWIAPFDNTIGPKHILFIKAILSSGGKVFLYRGKKTLGPIKQADGRILTLLKGSGSDRNSSGIAVLVHDHVAKLNWLLTGDVEYQYLFSGSPPDPIVGMTVPHHGASLSSPKSIPPSPHLNYQRLIYSFGPGNSYAHPKTDCIKSHIAKGWNHGSWISPNVAKVFNGDVLATASNPPERRHLGSLITGWTTAPSFILRLPCGGKSCSASLSQY